MHAATEWLWMSLSFARPKAVLPIYGNVTVPINNILLTKLNVLHSYKSHLCMHVFCLN